MTIKGILFDAADVFYRRPEPTSVHVTRLLAAQGFGSELSAQDLQRQRALREQANNGQISAEEYWKQFLRLRGVTDPQQLGTLVDTIDSYSDNVIAIPGGREALTALKQRGFSHYIVTDTIYPLERKMRWLAAIGIADLVDGIACSSALGFHKPDPTIYLHALQQAHLSADQAAFVGHDARELQGAQQVGLATIAVNYDPQARADYYAQSLLDLLNVPILKGTAG